MIKIKPNMADQIRNVCKLAASKNRLQALENVLIRADKRLELTSGDGVVQITALIDAEIQSKGETTVNAGKLLQAVTACNFECDLVFKDDSVLVKTSKKKITLKTLPADIYPEYQDRGDYKEVKCDVSDIKAVSISAPTGDSRPFLNGVHLGSNIEATNAHRLTVMEIDTGSDVIVPSESIRKIPNDDFKISASNSVIRFESESLLFQSKLVDAKYPDFMRNVIASDNIVTANVESLTDAVKTALITTGGESQAVTIKWGKSCTVESFSKNTDASVIEFDGNGDNSGSFNGSYVLDALSFYGGEVEIDITDQRMMINRDGVINVVMSIKK